MPLPNNDETADLIEQLQLEDIEDFFDASKGTSQFQPDQEIAFRLRRAQLQMARNFHAIRRIVRTQTATDDRRLDHTCTEAQPPAFPEGTQSQQHFNLEYADDETLLDLGILSPQSAPENAGPVQAELSQVASRHGESPESKRSCIICGDEIEISNIVRLPCGHDFCSGCINKLFVRSLTGKSPFPPRCCSKRPAVPLNLVHRLLKEGLEERYKKEGKKIELETPDPTYCHDRRCSAFIYPSYIEQNIATCPKCACETCTICKSPKHSGACTKDPVSQEGLSRQDPTTEQDAASLQSSSQHGSATPQDPATQEVLQMACEEGWKQCYDCGEMVERVFGCNRIECICGIEFCYNCRQPWDANHECNQQAVHDFLPPPNPIIAIDHGLQGPATSENSTEEQDPDLDELASTTMQEVEGYNMCAHIVWIDIDGPGLCLECLRPLPGHVIMCRRCGIRRCARCRRDVL